MRVLPHLDRERKKNNKKFKLERKTTSLSDKIATHLRAYSWRSANFGTAVNPNQTPKETQMPFTNDIDKSSFKALINGLIKRMFYGEADLSNDFLQKQLFASSSLTPAGLFFYSFFP